MIADDPGGNNISMLALRSCMLFVVLVYARGLPAEEAHPIPSDVTALLQRYCVSCHGSDKQRGKIRLDGLASLKGDARQDLLNSVREQIYFEAMPPEDSRQPTQAERKLIDRWLAQDLALYGPLKLEDNLRQPQHGNWLSHEKLFSGEHKDLKGFTYDRRWLISEFIFDAKMNRILKHSPFITVDGKREPVIGSNNRSSAKISLTNPFLLPQMDGVRYYANEPLNGGHLLTMLTNVRVASAYMLTLCQKDKNYLPAAAAIMANEWALTAKLNARNTFLSNHMDRILNELYKDQHEKLLPAFVKTAPPETSRTAESATKKAPFHAANPGQKELEVIYLTMIKYEKDCANDAQLIERCERDWFCCGDNDRTIQTRVVFLQNYMEEWRQQIAQHKYAERTKPPIYKSLPPGEMKIVSDAILKVRKSGDTYAAIKQKCNELWEVENRQVLAKDASVSASTRSDLTAQLYMKLFERLPLPEELAQYAAMFGSYLEAMSRQQAIEKVIQTLMLRSEFVYREEFGAGSTDDVGRRMMSPRDASYALAYALTDSSPDKELVEAAQGGNLATREDYKREVLRMLKRRDQYYVLDEAVQSLGADSHTNMPVRELRFFREFFGYPRLLSIFKDDKRFGGKYENAKGRIVSEADLWVAYVLESDRNVFEKLLGSDEFYVFHSGDNTAIARSSQHIRKLYEYFKDKNWKDFTLEDLTKHQSFLLADKMRGVNAEDLTIKGRQNPLMAFKSTMTSYTARFDKGQQFAPPFNSFSMIGPSEAYTRSGFALSGEEAVKAFNIDLSNWNYPVEQPAKVANRKGMLTHPAWLIAHSKNTETDPIRRGKWIREKLLAGSIPEIPVTVDAVIPEDPHKTLRQRLDAKTKDSYCWGCHQSMNPLGLPFEMYDDFGRFRTKEALEYPEHLIKKSPDKGQPYDDTRDIYNTLPVDSRGQLVGTVDKNLDGEIANALEMTERLAKSTRVRQSIIRHAFRYFLGRNEILSDSRTLMEADKAYVESGGSFDAVIVSLLTSDSFIYRKPSED